MAVVRRRLPNVCLYGGTPETELCFDCKQNQDGQTAFRFHKRVRASSGCMFAFSLRTKQEDFSTMMLLRRNSIKILIGCWMLFLIGSGQAFVSSSKRLSAYPNSLTLPSKTTSFLHPEQAAELEACAYDLMREYNHAMANQQEHCHKLLQPPAMVVAPVAWCRRWIGRRSNGVSLADNNHNSDATMWKKQP